MPSSPSGARARCTRSISPRTSARPRYSSRPRRASPPRAGCSTGDVKYDHQVTVGQRLADADETLVAEHVETLSTTGREQLARDGFDEDRTVFEPTLDCLYEGQGYELNVPFDGTDGDWRDRVRARFEETHEAEYGHHFENDPVELLTVRVTAIGGIEAYEPTTLAEGDADPEVAHTADSAVVFGTSEKPERLTTPRYDRERLRAGNRIEGPAIVDEFDSTVVLNPGWEALVAESGAIRLTR